MEFSRKFFRYLGWDNLFHSSVPLRFLLGIFWCLRVAHIYNGSFQMRGESLTYRPCLSQRMIWGFLFGASWVSVMLHPSSGLFLFWIVSILVIAVVLPTLCSQTVCVLRDLAYPASPRPNTQSTFLPFQSWLFWTSGSEMHFSIFCFWLL